MQSYQHSSNTSTGYPDGGSNGHNCYHQQHGSIPQTSGPLSLYCFEAAHSNHPVPITPAAAYPSPFEFGSTQASHTATAAEIEQYGCHDSIREDEHAFQQEMLNSFDIEDERKMPADYLEALTNAAC